MTVTLRNSVASPADFLAELPAPLRMRLEQAKTREEAAAILAEGAEAIDRMVEARPERGEEYAGLRAQIDELQQKVQGPPRVSLDAPAGAPDEVMPGPEVIPSRNASPMRVNLDPGATPNVNNAAPRVSVDELAKKGGKQHPRDYQFGTLPNLNDWMPVEAANNFLGAVIETSLAVRKYGEGRVRGKPGRGESRIGGKLPGEDESLVAKYRAKVESGEPGWTPRAQNLEGGTEVYGDAVKATIEYLDDHPELKGKPAKSAWELVTSPRKLAMTTTRLVPYMGATIALGMVTRGKIVPFMFSMMVEGQNAYDNAKAKGATHQQANDVRNSYGPVAAMLEMAQVGRLKKVAAQAAGLGLPVREFVLNAVQEAGQEMAQGTAEETFDAVFAKQPIEGGVWGFIDRRLQEAIAITAMTGLAAGSARLTGGSESGAKPDIELPPMEQQGGLRRAFAGDRGMAAIPPGQGPEPVPAAAQEPPEFVSSEPKIEDVPPPDYDPSILREMEGGGFARQNIATGQEEFVPNRPPAEVQPTVDPLQDVAATGGGAVPEVRTEGQIERFSDMITYAAGLKEGRWLGAESGAKQRGAELSPMLRDATKKLLRSEGMEEADANALVDKFSAGMGNEHVAAVRKVAAIVDRRVAWAELKNLKKELRLDRMDSQTRAEAEAIIDALPDPTRKAETIAKLTEKLNDAEAYGEFYHGYADLKAARDALVKYELGQSYDKMTAADIREFSEQVKTLIGDWAERNTVRVDGQLVRTEDAALALGESAAEGLVKMQPPEPGAVKKPDLLTRAENAMRKKVGQRVAHAVGGFLRFTKSMAKFPFSETASPGLKEHIVLGRQQAERMLNDRIDNMEAGALIFDPLRTEAQQLLHKHNLTPMRDAALRNDETQYRLPGGGKVGEGVTDSNLMMLTLLSERGITHDQLIQIWHNGMDFGSGSPTKLSPSDIENIAKWTRAKHGEMMDDFARVSFQNPDITRVVSDAYEAATGKKLPVEEGYVPSERTTQELLQLMRISAASDPSIIKPVTQSTKAYKIGGFLETVESYLTQAEYYQNLQFARDVQKTVNHPVAQKALDARLGKDGKRAFIKEMDKTLRGWLGIRPESNWQFDRMFTNIAGAKLKLSMKAHGIQGVSWQSWGPRFAQDPGAYRAKSLEVMAESLVPGSKTRTRGLRVINEFAPLVKRRYEHEMHALMGTGDTGATSYERLAMGKAPGRVSWPDTLSPMDQSGAIPAAELFVLDGLRAGLGEEAALKYAGRRLTIAMLKSQSGGDVFFQASAMLPENVNWFRRSEYFLGSERVRGLDMVAEDVYDVTRYDDVASWRNLSDSTQAYVTNRASGFAASRVRDVLLTLGAVGVAALLKRDKKDAVSLKEELKKELSAERWWKALGYELEGELPYYGRPIGVVNRAIQAARQGERGEIDILGGPVGDTVEGVERGGEATIGTVFAKPTKGLSPAKKQAAEIAQRKRLVDIAVGVLNAAELGGVPSGDLRLMARKTSQIMNRGRDYYYDALKEAVKRKDADGIAAAKQRLIDLGANEDHIYEIEHGEKPQKVGPLQGASGITPLQGL